MTREPRPPMTAGIVRKGEGAIPEQIPTAPQRAPVQTVPAAKEATTALTVRMPDSLHERLRLLAFQDRRGKGDLVIEALERFLDGAGV